MSNINSFLDYACKKYYQGSPIITDEEFDHLADLHSYSKVGFDSSDGVKHPYPMYSLEKIYKGEGTHPIEKLNEHIIETVKLDGAAVSLYYVYGRLQLLLTRGDGIRGQDVSHLIPAFPAPNKIDNIDFIQVTGELVAPKSIDNARNYAAGALNLKDIQEFRTRYLTFVAYGVNGLETGTYNQSLVALFFLGFNTVLTTDISNFPTDGLVRRINCNYTFEDLGYTSKHPKGAYAIKERKAGIVTTLKEVIWQIGKSGVVSPVAILEPIVIDGATISRATLHNMKYINDLGLEIGCQVEVVRSGDIIPRVVKRI